MFNVSHIFFSNACYNCFTNISQLRIHVFYVTRFDTGNNAALCETDFVAGWIQFAKDEEHSNCLAKIKKMVGEDNLML